MSCDSPDFTPKANPLWSRFPSDCILDLCLFRLLPFQSSILLDPVHELLTHNLFFIMSDEFALDANAMCDWMLGFNFYSCIIRTWPLR